MNRSLVRALPTALAVGLLAVFAAACGSSEDAPAGAKKMSFKLTDAGCTRTTPRRPPARSTSKSKTTAPRR